MYSADLVIVCFTVISDTVIVMYQQTKQDRSFLESIPLSKIEALAVVSLSQSES